MASTDLTNQGGYPPPSPHDPIEEIFPDVFMVRGSLQMTRLMRINRNMVVVRNGDELTVINSIRLTEQGEQALDALGQVRHVLRLGYYHGRDDSYYKDKYGAEFWAPEGARTEPGPPADRIICEDQPLPFANARALLFKQSRFPEAVLMLEQHGGVLLTCDCLQYYTDRRFNSLITKIMMPMMGFPLRMLVGPMWLKAMTPKGGSLHPDFERIMNFEFEHFVSAHGSLCRGGARDKVRVAIAKAFSAERT